MGCSGCSGFRGQSHLRKNFLYLHVLAILLQDFAGDRLVAELALLREGPLSNFPPNVEVFNLL